MQPGTTKTMPGGAQGGAAILLESDHETIEYDLKDEDFRDTNDNPPHPMDPFFEITDWDVSIRSKKLAPSATPEVTISVRESDSGAWDVKCSPVTLGEDTNWHESDECSVDWAGMTARKLQIERESGDTAHVDAVLLRPTLQ